MGKSQHECDSDEKWHEDNHLCRVIVHGDLDKIQVVGRYFVEVWKAAGMNLNNVQFLWASDEINKDPSKYWKTVIDISR